MDTFKKILAVLVMGLCILGILLAFSGIAGSWILNRTAVREGAAFLQRAASTLASLDSGLGAVQGGVGAAKGLIQQFAGIPLVGGLVDPLSESVAGLSSQLTSMQGEVSELQGMVDALQAGFGTWLNLATLATTIFLLWFGAAQVSLFYHALGWYRRAGAESGPRPEEHPAQSVLAPETTLTERRSGGKTLLPETPPTGSPDAG